MVFLSMGFDRNLRTKYLEEVTYALGCEFLRRSIEDDFVNLSVEDSFREFLDVTWIGAD